MTRAITLRSALLLLGLIPSLNAAPLHDGAQGSASNEAATANSNMNAASEHDIAIESLLAMLNSNSAAVSSTSSSVQPRDMDRPVSEAQAHQSQDANDSNRVSIIDRLGKLLSRSTSWMQSDAQAAATEAQRADDAAANEQAAQESTHRAGEVSERATDQTQIVDAEHSQHKCFGRNGMRYAEVRCEHVVQAEGLQQHGETEAAAQGAVQQKIQDQHGDHACAALGQKGWQMVSCEHVAEVMGQSQAQTKQNQQTQQNQQQKTERDTARDQAQEAQQQQQQEMQGQRAQQTKDRETQQAGQQDQQGQRAQQAQQAQQGQQNQQSGASQSRASNRNANADADADANMMHAASANDARAQRSGTDAMRQTKDANRQADGAEMNDATTMRSSISKRGEEAKAGSGSESAKAATDAEIAAAMKDRDQWMEQDEREQREKFAWALGKGSVDGETEDARVE